MERVACNSLRRIPSDELDGLHNTIHNLDTDTQKRKVSEDKIMCTSCSIPEYSPSVFSRMSTVSTSSYGVLNPLMETQGLTFANKLNVLLRVRFKETWPLPTVIQGTIRLVCISGRVSRSLLGVARGPGTRQHGLERRLESSESRKRTFQGNRVLLDRVDSSVGYHGPSTLQDWVNADLLPLDRNLASGQHACICLIKVHDIHQQRCRCFSPPRRFRGRYLRSSLASELY